MIFYDYRYIFFMLPIFIISLIAQISVKSTFSKYQKVSNKRYITGADAAKLILQKNGISYIKVEKIQGQLTDHYDPKTNTIRLSESVYSSTSVAAVGVAAHEAGHAVQHEQEYAPMKIRSALVPVCNISAMVSPYLMFLGIFLDLWSLFTFAIILYSVAALFQFVTLPVEFNASRRALEAINDYNVLDNDELRGAKKVLSAAAMTYVVALAASVMQIIYFITRYGNNRRD